MGGGEEEWKGEGELLAECWVNLWEHLGAEGEEKGEEGSFWFQGSLSPCGEIEGFFMRIYVAYLRIYKNLYISYSLCICRSIYLFI